MSVDTVSMTGWGRTAPTTALRFRPRTYEEAAVAVTGRGPRGVVARGLGRAHGDAAQNAGGSVVEMTGLDRVHTIDTATGTVVCDAGVSLHRLMEVLLPLGWFLPVTPSTRYVTVGGAIGSDLHGRNHLAAGSFTRHVRSLELLTADGAVHTVLPGSALFDATAGGLGLTGVVLSATLSLRPVATSWMSVVTERAADLDEALARLSASGGDLPYTAARIDLLARGKSTGRAVLTHGEHAPLDALPSRARRTPLVFRPAQLPAAPAYVPEGLLGRASAALLAELRFRGAGAVRAGRLQRVSSFLHPLDALPGWNRLHGRDGFVQYRFAVGAGQEQTLHRVVRRLSLRRCPAFHAELQRLGAGGPGWLSFPVPGWSLSFALPAGVPGLARLLDRLDEDVAAAGGRVCLAQDARMRPEALAAMYPRLADFRALRGERDPDGAFRSDLSRRLAL
ncbi:FAD-binding oxidoreductase [Streptomyces sp. NBC_01754]|uniref:FAD-binding oxidoreductase n=1 Tax=Streptomyces sp. NBC_01754 TaxID=2975930 RepID=UPI002DD9AFBF|nr:FAD-binding oxidoreductase [Streptomyces sp. NBC_01754]WSC94422.1 FAD-binding oxidoreductase [Streptomyces sp. NBC_01754]